MEYLGTTALSKVSPGHGSYGEICLEVSYKLASNLHCVMAILSHTFAT